MLSHSECCGDRRRVAACLPDQIGVITLLEAHGTFIAGLWRAAVAFTRLSCRRFPRSVLQLYFPRLLHLMVIIEE